MMNQEILPFNIILLKDTCMHHKVIILLADSIHTGLKDIMHYVLESNKMHVVFEPNMYTVCL